jgi:hypothetical protein
MHIHMLLTYLFFTLGFNLIMNKMFFVYNGDRSLPLHDVVVEHLLFLSRT